MWDAWLALDLKKLLVADVSVLEMFVRGTVMYLGLFVVLRVLRRPAGQLSIADLLLITILADASQNALGGTYQSITSGMVLVLTIVGWDQVIDRLSFRWPWFSRLVDPGPVMLVRDGAIQWRNLRRHQLSRDELMSHLRQQGVGELAEVRRCFLEGDGSISVLKRQDR
ncbi:MAG: DUF421 domain-containing protein [Panacagrimonas sp.]